MIKYIFVAPDGAVTQLGEYPNVLSKEMLDAMMYGKFKFIYEQYGGKFSHYSTNTDDEVIIVVLPSDQVTVAQSSVLQNPATARPSGPISTEWRVEEKLVSTNLLGAQLAELRRNASDALEMFSPNIVKYVLLTSNKLVRYLMASGTMSGTMILEEIRRVYPEAQYTDWVASEVFGNGTEIPIAFVYHHSNDAMVRAEASDLYKQIQYTFYAGNIAPANPTSKPKIEVREEIGNRYKLEEVSAGVLQATNLGGMDATTDNIGARAYDDLLEWEETVPEIGHELHILYEGVFLEEAAITCARSDFRKSLQEYIGGANESLERYIIYFIPQDEVTVIDTERSRAAEAIEKYVKNRDMKITGRSKFESRKWQDVTCLYVAPEDVNYPEPISEDYAILKFMEKYDAIMSIVSAESEEEDTEREDREAALTEARKSDQERMKEYMDLSKSSVEALERIAKTMEEMLAYYKRK